MKWITFVLILFVFEKTECQNFHHDFLANISTTVIEQLSTKCQQDLNRISINLTSTLWLLLDSSSRIPSGIAKGNVEPMGNYDECLEIKEVETKFCQVSITFPETLGSNHNQIFAPPKRINIEAVGISQESTDTSIAHYYCVLKSCSAQDLNVIFNEFVRFDDDQCLSKDSKPNLDSLAVVAIIIFASITLITVMSTIYDIYLTYYSIHSSAIAFSLYSNGKKLFQLGNSQQLKCLNGIKSLSMLWVVFAHVYAVYDFLPLDNSVEVYEWKDSVYSQYITGAPVSVDTFLVIGGFLTIYTFQATMDKGTKFNVPLYYVHRYLRLTPALAAMVLAHAALFNYFGSGPVWQRTDTYLVKACKKNWWSALLYVQNYANPGGICVPQSWYLSVDMQLFLISPLILVLMRQWPIWGYVCLTIVSLSSITGSFLIGWFYKLNGQVTGNVRGKFTYYMTYYYLPTHTRMVPYLFGILLGHAIYQMKKSKTAPRVNIILVVLGWVFSLVLMAVCIYGGHTLESKTYNRLANSFFIALMRPTWAITICWVIFACVMGYGGPIDTFLSLPIFQILSRLCYSIYLVHYSFIFMTNFSTRTSVHFSDWKAFHSFWGDLVISAVIAVVWTLVFESPIIVLEKVLLGRRSEPRRDNKTSLV